MKKCKICFRDLDESLFYTTRTKKRNDTGYWVGARLECKECTLNRNQLERELWKNKLFSVYLLPEENYCGYTNNVRHRMNQHKRAGKNIEGFQVVFASDNPIEAHLVETQYHFDGYGGFKSNIGLYNRRIHKNRHTLLQTELENEHNSTI